MTPVHLFLLLSLMSGAIFSATTHADTPDADDESLSTSDIINANMTRRRGGTHPVDPDITVQKSGNASLCTGRDCKWPKLQSYVFVPVDISDSYSNAEYNTIVRSLVSFHKSTCIRFVWRDSSHQSYLYFFSGNGCWSYVGHQGGPQAVSIQKQGCVSLGEIHHEVLLALGLHHKRASNGKLGRRRTHHGSGFSRRRSVLPKPKPSAHTGLARQLSKHDIARVNRLYQC